MKTGSYDMGASHGYLLRRRLRLGLDATEEGERTLELATRHPVPVDTFYTLLSPYTFWTWAWLLITLAAVSATLVYINR